MEGKTRQLEIYDRNASGTGLFKDAADLLRDHFPVVLKEDGEEEQPPATGVVFHGGGEMGCGEQLETPLRRGRTRTQKENVGYSQPTVGQARERGCPWPGIRNENHVTQGCR